MLRIKLVHRSRAPARYLATHAAAVPTQRPLLLEDVRSESERDKLPQFTISTERGFLPRLDPLVQMPQQFQPLDSLLQRMTIHQSDGSRGLLALGQFGDAVKAELGQSGVDLVKNVDKVIESSNQHLMSALFRDFCFATSAYLLEPVDQAFRATGQYAPGRAYLPKELAVPISKLADALGHNPFMEYSSSYALQNYQRVKGGNTGAKVGEMSSWQTDNLRLIRAFENISPSSSESGFITVHVTMVAETGRIVAGAENVLAAASAKDVRAFRSAMQDLLATYQRINAKMETMWSYSKPADYLKFRSFIFGTGPEKANSMFPNGVIYEGISDKPQVFRGESGANDSIIPLADNLLQITEHMPKNPLTATLREFRNYRPAAQRVYLEALEKRSIDAGIAEFARADKECLALYILMIDQVREFRDRHWRFTKSYIIERSAYLIATGGSPILKYLPNNLRTVLNVMADAFAGLPTSEGLPPTLAQQVDAARGRAETQRNILDREVAKLQEQAQSRPEAIVDTSKWVRGSVGGDGVG